MGRGQTDTQTDGHVDSLTNSAQRAELVKVVSKFWMSISRSKERWRSYICIPSGAKIHIIAHTKEEL